MTTARWGQITLVLVILAIGYYFFAVAQGSITVGKTIKPANTTLETGLTGHWTFDGADVVGTTTNDVSGNGRDGTMQNGAKIGIGKIGQGVYGDGVGAIVAGDRVNIGHFLSNFITASEGTMSLWIKPEGVSPTIGGDVFDLDTYLGNIGGFAGIHRGSIGGPDRLWIYNYDAGGTDTVGIPYEIGEWVHVTWTHSNGMLYAYKNGELIDNVASGDTGSLSTPLILLNGYGGAAEGYIDDVRTYNRALSADEIKQIYNLGGSKVGKTPTPTGLDSGLVGHWTFDGPDMINNVADVSGNEKHGTLNLAATTTAIGRLGQALDLRSSNNRVNLPNTVLIDNSISMWIYPTSGGTVYETLFTQNYDNGFYYSSANNKLNFYVAGDHESTGLVTENEWNHVVVTVDDLGATGVDIKFYINGVAAGNIIEPLLTFTGYTANRIGNDSGNEKFYGIIDDVRAYNRVLSTDEITRLNNLGGGSKVNKTPTPTGLDSGLVGHWTFDGPDVDWGSTTAEIKDASGNGNDGNASVGMGINTSVGLGVVGQALKLNFNDSVNVSSTAIGDTFTFSGWLFPESRANLYACIICDYDASWGIYHLNDTNIISFWYSLSDHSSTRVADVGEWTHVSVVNDAGSVTFYINGEISGTANSAPTGTVMRIGNDQISEDFVGKFDDFRLYNNRALSADEVRQLYNMGR